MPQGSGAYKSLFLSFLFFNASRLCFALFHISYLGCAGRVLSVLSSVCLALFSCFLLLSVVHYLCVFGLFGLVFGGVSWLVLCLLVVRVGWLVWSRGLWSVAGCGRVGRCRVVRGGILRRLVCLCLSARLRWLLCSRVGCLRWAGVLGCVRVPWGRRCSRPAACRFRRLRSRWLCLVGCRCGRRALCCLPYLGCLRWRSWVFSLALPGVVAVAGSRALPAFGSALVVRVVSDLAASGASLVVGCCVGADAALLSAVPGSVPPSLVCCLCAFGADGVGAGKFSAVCQVSAFAGSGGSVLWWAGGSVAVPVYARLAVRTRAVVAAASAGLVVFFSSPVSRGSLLACLCAVGRGLPVVAFPVGFSGALLPSLGLGSWVPVGGGFGWVSGQLVLF